MYVKVCGITHIDDALAALDAGADLLGFNCIPSSRRHLAGEEVARIVERVRAAAPSVECVAVVADLTTERARALLVELGVHALQLHGDESPTALAALGPRAFKAVRIGDAADAERAAGYGGDRLLVDAKVPGQLGGTGRCIDWVLVAPLARARRMILAGGLTPENVERAIEAVQPWGVDVASGVERDTDARRKDPDKLRRFVAAARAAAVGGPAPLGR